VQHATYRATTPEHKRAKTQGPCKADLEGTASHWRLTVDLC